MDRISLVKLMRQFEAEGYLTILGYLGFPDEIAGIPFRLKKYYVVTKEELVEPNLLLKFNGELQIVNRYNGNELINTCMNINVDSTDFINELIDSVTKYIQSINLSIRSNNSIPIFNLVENTNEDIGK